MIDKYLEQWLIKANNVLKLGKTRAMETIPLRSHFNLGFSRIGIEEPFS
jgi:hypothetical protein